MLTYRTYVRYLVAEFPILRGLGSHEEARQSREASAAELGWSDEHAAYRVRIRLERYLMIVNGNGNPEPDEIEKIVAEMALARNELLSWVRRPHQPGQCYTAAED